jgi:hypothetical protein
MQLQSALVLLFPVFPVLPVVGPLLRLTQDWD